MLAVGNGWFWFENGCWLSKMGHLMALMSLPVISVYCLCCSFRVQSLFVSTLITCSLSMISVVGSQYKFGRCQKRQAVAVWLENSNGKLKLVADRAVSNHSVVTRWNSGLWKMAKARSRVEQADESKPMRSGWGQARMIGQLTTCGLSIYLIRSNHYLI